jgi:protein-L-isoaspartate(D-aspartate) O-methyltransferase
MTVHSAIPDFRAARAAMVDSQLRPQGVTDAAVVAAMAFVPREDFVAAEARSFANSDRAVPIGAGRSLAAPSVLGQLLTELAPFPGEHALVVASGTGYSAAVLAAMKLDVTALESDSALAASARAAGVPAVEGKLELGWPDAAPYDLILIDGAIEHVPPAFIGQLPDGGRLGGALIDRGVTRLFIGRKSAGAFGIRTIGDAGVPPLPGFARPQAFQF